MSTETTEPTKEEETPPTPTEDTAAPAADTSPSAPAESAQETAPAKCEGENDTTNEPVSSTGPDETTSNVIAKETTDSAPTDGAPDATPSTTEDKDLAPPVPSAPKDPLLGKFLEQTKVVPAGYPFPMQGKVIEHVEAEGRLPPRYTVHWETSEAFDMQDQYLAEELAAEIPPAGNLKLVLDQLQARYKHAVESELESNNILSTLLLFAAMEEALQTNLQTYQLGDASGGGSATTKGHKGDAHPPLYYTLTPSSYLKPPTATESAPNAAAHRVGLTPASLAQRVRAGSQWAYKYLSAQQPTPPQPPILPSSQTQRRSLRQPKPPPPPQVPYPTPVQHGGRVAMWWLQQLEERATGSTQKEKGKKDKEPQDVEEKEEKSTAKTLPPKEPKTTTSSSSSPDKPDETTDDPMIQDDEEEEEEEDSEAKNDDDDEYGSKDADMEEEEEEEDLEDVEAERKGTLSPVADPDDNDDNHKEEETEEDLEQAVLYENPYLQPSFPAFLEHLAHPRALGGEAVQTALLEAILRIKFNKRTVANGLDTETLGTVDQVVLDQETPDYPPGMVVLRSLAEETFSELQKMDAQAFSRCKFSLDVIGDQESSMQMQRKQELILQEIQFKEQKNWDRYRYKAIHEGSTVWPSWDKAVEVWFQENCTAATEPTEETPTIPTDTPKAPDAVDDEALAKSLEENEASSGRRRTARRAAASASEGVFYGNQSQLTQKQLMDALVRLVKTNKVQTLVRLQSLVADDSSDPIRRSRTALGRLVWKRNQLSRKPMTAELSDLDLLKSIPQKPLLAIQSPEAPAEGEEDKPPRELSDEEAGLLAYIQQLHTTELHLRKFVTRNLAEIPVSIIATAADERPGSMEAMDAGDFGDPSQIEWHTSGHDWIKKLIFRPANAAGMSNEMTPCFWYEIQDYCKSIDSQADDKDEPDSKERRMRFRAVPIPPPGERMAEQEAILILTEGQVHAGMKAAELEKRTRATTSSKGNPFASAGGDKVTLIPVDSEAGGAKEINGRIVGYDNVIPDDDDEVEYRILVLPDEESKEAFWASLDIRADSASYVCQPVGESTTWYSIEQFDYHQSSEAYRQCEAVLTYLHRQSKAGPFMTPVDPVALNIPTYPLIVKHPMDVSTITDKLENGQYSRILPGESVGNSPASRMLNGPFRKDVELMFNNAMLFNPPDDWIYQAAAQLKKNTLKKIADLSYAADQKLSGAGRQRAKSSLYVEEDSDVDMYEYESDQDEEFVAGGRKARKRKRSGRGGAQKDEFAARAVEHPIRLQHTLRDPSNLRGPFGNLPINQNPTTFSLPQEWGCRLAAPINEPEQQKESSATKKRTQEMAELLAMQKEVEEHESANLRRSTRAHVPTTGRASSNKSGKALLLEYYKTKQSDEDETVSIAQLGSRTDVEVHAEKLHEKYYAKLYQKYSKLIGSESEGFGTYTNGAFPPFMGRVVPISGWEEVSWEIRAPFVIPALRWVLRGLVSSGHLTAVEPMTSDIASGILLSNDIYYWDTGLQPFEILDSRELQRKKRANKSEAEDSEDDVEMSEYEQARAARVARNAERLKALGLG